jgi:hypothetical protein
MTYTPFKLQGHELPGPNQKDPSPAKYTDVDPRMYRGVPDTTGRDDITYSGTGYSNMRKRGESIEEYELRMQGSHDVQKIGSEDGRTEGGWDPAARAQARKEALNQTVSGEQAQYVDSGITDSYGTEVNNQEETKVPVDVEVTVNGQPV